MINSEFDRLQESYDEFLLEEHYPIEIGVEDMEAIILFKRERSADYSDYIERSLIYKNKTLDYRQQEDEDLKYLVRDLPEATENLLEEDDFNQEALYEYIQKDFGVDPLKALIALDEDFKKEIEAKVKEKLFDLAKNTKWEIYE